MKIDLQRYLFLWILFFSAPVLAGPFTHIYVFGDSLSDTGNLGLPLDASLHLVGAEQSGNYAFAGARAGGNLVGLVFFIQ